MTNSTNTKSRAATETADALNDAIIRKARTLTDANRKYELATSAPSEVTSLGWQIIAIDLRTYGSSDLTIWRAAQCEKHAAALRERSPMADLDEHFERMAPTIAAINEGMAKS